MLKRREEGESVTVAGAAGGSAKFRSAMVGAEVNGSNAAGAGGPGAADGAATGAGRDAPAAASGVPRGAAAVPCSRRHSRQPLGPNARPCRSQRARIPELTAPHALEHESYRIEAACQPLLELVAA